MDRRTLLKILGGIAALPALGKAIKGAGIKATKAAKVAGKVLPKVSGMPEWFTPLVNKIMKEGKDISPKVKNVEDIELVKKLEIPSATGEPEVITLTQNKVTGEISIEANVSGGVADAPFELNYRPPKTDINLETGAEIKYPGDFSVVEKRPRPVREPGDYEFDYDNFNIDEAFSDVERLEKIATGKIKDVKKIEQRAKGRDMVEESPYEDIMNRYPDPPDSDYYANGGIASFANGGLSDNEENNIKEEDVLTFGQNIFNPNELFFGPVEQKKPSFSDRIKNNQKLKEEGLTFKESKDFVKNYLEDQTARGLGLGYGGPQYGAMVVKPYVGPDRSLSLQGYYNTDEGSRIEGMLNPREQRIDYTGGNGLNFFASRDTYSGRPNKMFGININTSFKDGGLTKTVPPVRGPNPQGVESLFKKRYR